MFWSLAHHEHLQFDTKYSVIRSFASRSHH